MSKKKKKRATPEITMMPPVMMNEMTGAMPFLVPPVVPVPVFDDVIDEETADDEDEKRR